MFSWLYGTINIHQKQKYGWIDEIYDVFFLKKFKLLELSHHPFLTFDTFWIDSGPLCVGPIWITFHALSDIKERHGLFEKSMGILPGTIDRMSKYVTASWTGVGNCSPISPPLL